MASNMEAKKSYSDADWEDTPAPVRRYIFQLEQTIRQMVKKIDKLEIRTTELETKTKSNSQNSDKPPSSDNPFKKPEKDKPKKKKSKRKRGAQKGHKGARQKLQSPTEIKHVLPGICVCGCSEIASGTLKSFYIHQHIELPEIQMDVTHFKLQMGQCMNCGKTLKAHLPKEYRYGFGSRLSALVAELSGIQGASREVVRSFCKSVLGFPISTGGIQRVIDRSSQSIEPFYDEIGKKAREQDVNYVDETSWFQGGKLKWLWTMVNTTVAYFLVHAYRSQVAFLELIQQWRGILVSDNYGVYVNWANSRQTCLAHYIRRARGLAEHKDESLNKFGKQILKELRLLCKWANAPPSEKEWTAFYSRLILLLFLYEGGDDEAGKFARLILREMDCLWVFLEENGVEPTNNRAERSIRFGVLWRKRSHGTQSDKGDRWVERILSLKETCRIRGISSFSVLAHAMDAYVKELKPDVSSWIV